MKVNCATSSSQILWTDNKEEFNTPGFGEDVKTVVPIEPDELTDSDEKADLECTELLNEDGANALFDSLSVGLSAWLLNIKNWKQPTKYKKWMSLGSNLAMGTNYNQ
ncbi:uncharacterized protein FOMMEDRAFT_163132 [Fomitiporia mediterranea MF3/22]|uniref:Uncharacterized protein n=1 Tax=Fomitiporia mediterranea (strain MF3/22) TaxID=694068 RepID=R7SFH7_FOMME|nr:uncharacterized protein FOMMEDRAFT_163132 [Fomitiporia mediterranea MF3/22]EJC97481.1 hypothetical protein FOMMEDRAFT_163132 [Fomitiporia mediterranea MF3/22]